MKDQLKEIIKEAKTELFMRAEYLDIPRKYQKGLQSFLEQQIRKTWREAQIETKSKHVCTYESYHNEVHKDLQAPLARREKK